MIYFNGLSVNTSIRKIIIIQNGRDYENPPLTNILPMNEFEFLLLVRGKIIAQ